MQFSEDFDSSKPKKQKKRKSEIHEFLRMKLLDLKDRQNEVRGVSKSDKQKRYKERRSLGQRSSDCIPKSSIFPSNQTSRTLKRHINEKENYAPSLTTRAPLASLIHQHSKGPNGSFFYSNSKDNIISQNLLNATERSSLRLKIVNKSSLGGPAKERSDVMELITKNLNLEEKISIKDTEILKITAKYEGLERKVKEIEGFLMEFVSSKEIEQKSWIRNSIMNVLGKEIREGDGRSKWLKGEVAMLREEKQEVKDEVNRLHQVIKEYEEEIYHMRYSNLQCDLDSAVKYSEQSTQTELQPPSKLPTMLSILTQTETQESISMSMQTEIILTANQLSETVNVDVWEKEAQTNQILDVQDPKLEELKDTVDEPSHSSQTDADSLSYEAKYSCLRETISELSMKNIELTKAIELSKQQTETLKMIFSKNEEEYKVDISKLRKMLKEERKVSEELRKKNGSKAPKKVMFFVEGNSPES